MDTKMNSRLKEIKLGIHINHIDKANDLIIYKNLLKLLSCVAISLSADANKRFSEIAQVSVCDGLVRATDKELCATMKTFFNKAEAIKRLNTTYPTFNKRYGALDDENYITDVLVKYLFNVKHTTRKTVFWNCFGHVVYNNLLNNIDSRTALCVVCGKRFKKANNKQKYCLNCKK